MAGGKSGGGGSGQQAGRGVPDGLVIGVLAALVGASGAVWAATGIGALVEHGRFPHIAYTGSVVAVRHLVSSPNDVAGAWPGAPAGTLPSPTAFYLILILLLFLLSAAILWAATWRIRRAARRRERKVSSGAWTPEVQAVPDPMGPMDQPTAPLPSEVAAAPGAPAPQAVGPGDLADPALVRAAMSPQAVLARAGRIRPDLTGAIRDPHAVGVALGRDVRGGGELYGGLDDSYLVVGPPRSGKTAHLVIPAVRAAPGPVVVVSQAVDVFHETADQRAQRGPVLVFDPLDVASGAIAAGTGASAPGEGGLATGRRPQVLRWGPQRGCEDATVATARARALVAGAAGHAGAWGAGGSAEPVAVLRCYLQAAVIDGAGMDRVLSWASNPDDPEPVRLLADSSWAADGWAADLRAAATADGPHREAVWRVVRAALSPLHDTRTLRACSPTRRDPFDVGALIREAGTFYLLIPADGGVPLAPLASALVEDVLGRCRAEARRTPTGRLAPPLLFVIDDAATTAPVAGLPELAASASRQGMTFMATLRSLEEGVERWGPSGASRLWRGSSVKVVLGAADSVEASGGSEYDAAGAGIAGDAPDRIRRAVAAARALARGGKSADADGPVGIDLPPGTGAVLHPRLAPVVTRFTPYWLEHRGGRLRTRIGR